MMSLPDRILADSIRRLSLQNSLPGKVSSERTSVCVKVRVMSNELQQIVRLLKRIVRNMESQDTPKRSSDPKQKEDQRVALAVVAIARGASSYQEIADELGVSRCTVSRNPGIRRAMEASIRDRRPESREAAEEYRWQQ